ncbi:pseudaminic acid cytidylyltransferase [Shewanella algidipiscicola]|uniref:Pseudaminic acid cytidylyltransferase n=1 Tax=Shewanella algidipiscicola TaxID=614070 RepID=A0ABQ4PFT5_9GAMM|nr:pseudaminic acid cytidylyltransferase [Shewanella algidipiscicola]GIU46269.1 pseudaminic acid cytidylyltransferase [Shewanella algidipiscicola]
MKPKILAIIPARGVSKRIKRKNIKPFLGQEIIAYPIKALLESGVVDRLVVSTDDVEIACAAKKFGADVPFMRSAKNADDFATTFDVVEEIVTQLEEQYDYVYCVYPTSVFVTSDLIKDALNTLNINPSATSIVTCVAYSNPIQRSLSYKDGYLQSNHPEFYNTRSQDLPKNYSDAGQLYLFKPDVVLKSKRLVTDKCLPLELDESQTQDIDSEVDWALAELKYGYMVN